MKRLSKLTLFLMALLLAGTASADDYTHVYIDGIYYDFSGNEATVTYKIRSLTHIQVR